MVEQGQGANTVAFDGPLTLQTVDAARDRLLAAMAKADPVSVDCSGATEVDLSFIQVLLAARRSAARLGRPFQLSGPAAGPLLATLRRGGFLADDDTEHADCHFWAPPPAEQASTAPHHGGTPTVAAARRESYDIDPDKKALREQDSF